MPIEADAYKSAEGILTVQDGDGNSYESRPEGVFKNRVRVLSNCVTPLNW